MQSISDVENFLQSMVSWRTPAAINTIHLEVLWDATLPIVY